MIDVEINGIVEPSEWDKLELAAGFSGQVWNDQQRLKKRMNGGIKHLGISNNEQTNEQIIRFDMTQFTDQNSFSLIEYQMNPKAINLIPLSLQY